MTRLSCCGHQLASLETFETRNFALSAQTRLMAAREAFLVAIRLASQAHHMFALVEFLSLPISPSLPNALSPCACGHHD